MDNYAQKIAFNITAITGIMGSERGSDFFTATRGGRADLRARRSQRKRKIPNPAQRTLGLANMVRDQVRADLRGEEEQI
jgi:hypothetical protein